MWDYEVLFHKRNIWEADNISKETCEIMRFFFIRETNIWEADNISKETCEIIGFFFIRETNIWEAGNISKKTREIMRCFCVGETSGSTRSQQGDTREIMRLFWNILDADDLSKVSHMILWGSFAKEKHSRSKCLCENVSKKEKLETRRNI